MPNRPQPDRDRTETRVRQWALRNNGDPLTNADVVALILAVDDDANDRNDEVLRILDGQNERLAALEGWQEAFSAEVISMSEHDAKHAEHLRAYHAPRRAGDDPDSDYTEERSRGAVRSPRYTREQIVSISIIGIVVVAANSAVTWLIVRALELAAR